MLCNLETKGVGMHKLLNCRIFLLLTVKVPVCCKIQIQISQWQNCQGSSGSILLT